MCNIGINLISVSFLIRFRCKVLFSVGESFLKLIFLNFLLYQLTDLYVRYRRKVLFVSCSSHFSKLFFLVTCECEEKNPRVSAQYKVLHSVDELKLSEEKLLLRLLLIKRE